MRLGRPLTLALVAAMIVPLALACAAAPASPGKRLDVGRDDGLPLAFAKGTAFNPTALLVRVRATPNKRVEVTWDTNCARGAKGKIREGSFEIGGRKTRRLKMGFKRPDDCLVNVLVGYNDSNQAGKLRVELFARG